MTRQKNKSFAEKYTIIGCIVHVYWILSSQGQIREVQQLSISLGVLNFYLTSGNFTFTLKMWMGLNLKKNHQV